MRTASTRQIAILAFVLVSALASNSGATEPARPQPPAPATPGASAGAGSLPDVVGIHTGIFIGDAYNLLKAYDVGKEVSVGQVIIQGLGDKPVVHVLKTATQGGDTITAHVTLPPEKQVVYEIRRVVRFEQGKEITTDVMLASLRKKYGPELRLRQGGVQWVMEWRFDQHGRPASPSSVYCTPHYFWGASAIGSISSEPGSPIVSVPFGIGIDTAFASKDPCQPLIFLTVFVDVVSRGGGDLVNQMTLQLTDISVENRAALATQAYVDNVAAEQEKQRMDKAKQQAPPKF